MPMNELYHHGIKGMHWGVRRYQNPDGTLTAAGKRRERANDRAVRRDAKQQRLWNAKNSSQLSDKELTDQIIRLQREKQLKDLTNQSVAPGRKKVKDFLARHGDLALSAAITAGVTIAVNKQIKDRLDPKKTDRDRRIDQINLDSEMIEKGYYTVNSNGKMRRTNKTDRLKK